MADLDLDKLTSSHEIISISSVKQGKVKYIFIEKLIS